MNREEQPANKNPTEEIPHAVKPNRIFNAKEFAKHPLTLLILGFILTGLVGTRLTSSSQERQADIERDVRHYETSTTAIVAFSDSIYKRYVRAGFLKSALARHAPKEEVKRRKELYDDAMVDQESSVLGYHLLIRDALREQDYDEFEEYYEFALKPRLDMMDRALTILVDEYVKAPPFTVMTRSHLSCADEMYKQVVVCNSAIVNSVFRSISSKRYLSGREVIDTQQKARSDLASGCPLWKTTTPPEACQVLPGSLDQGK